MNKDLKVIIAAVIAFVVVVAGIVTIAELNSRHTTPPTVPPWSPADFNAGALASGNTTLNITGDASSTLLTGNNTHHVYLNFYPSTNKDTLTYDSAVYNKSGTGANETLNMTSIVLNVEYRMNNDSLTETFTIKNTQSTEQAISMNYQVLISTLTNVTVSQGDPHYPVNATLVPATFGYTETYNFNSANLFGASFGNGVNCTFNWYSMEGILNSGSLIFNSYSYNTTTLKLNFSGFSIPPYSSLTLGEMSVYY